MRSYGVFALIFVLNSGVSNAADDADVLRFNDAFLAYKAAMQQPRVDLQMDAARDALAAGRTVFEPTDASLPVLMTNYGVVLFDGKHQEESKEILKEALKLAEEIHGKDSPQLIGILAALADAQSEYYAPGRQLKHYRRALKIVAVTDGKESDRYANLALRAGTNIQKYSNSTDGKKYLLEAHEQFLARKGATAIETGLAAFHLGRLEFARGRHKKSIEYVLAALKAFEAQVDDHPSYQLFARAMLVQAYEERGDTDLATEHCIAIGRLSKLRPNQEHQPLFRMAPSYPSELLMSGIEGYVDFSFTIDKNGFVKEPQVLEQVSTGLRQVRRGGMQGASKEDRSFEAAALVALLRFRYAPMFVDGKAMPVDNVKTRISFAIED